MPQPKKKVKKPEPKAKAKRVVPQPQKDTPASQEDEVETAQEVSPESQNEVSEAQTVESESSENTPQEASSEATSEVSEDTEAPTNVIGSDEVSSESTPEEKVETENEEVEPSDKNTLGKKILLFLVCFIGTILLVGTHFGAYMFGLQQGREAEKKVAEQASAKPTSVPSPTSKQIDLSAYSIAVLNGSGLPGQAAAVKKILEDTGFTVATIDNADKSDYQKTTIQAKKSVSSDFTQKLKDSLSKTYRVDETITPLESTATSDIVVTVGKEKTSE